MLVAEDAQKMLWLSVMVTPEGALHSALFGLCDREKHGRHLSTKTTCSDSILYRLFLHQRVFTASFHFTCSCAINSTRLCMHASMHWSEWSYCQLEAQHTSRLCMINLNTKLRALAQDVCGRCLLLKTLDMRTTLQICRNV